MGIDKHLADRARKYAAISEKKFEAILSERRERIVRFDPGGPSLGPSRSSAVGA